MKPPASCEAERRDLSLTIILSRHELSELPELAHQYERTMGFVRHIVVATSSANIKRRYRYIVEESNELEQRARQWLAQDVSEIDCVEVRMSYRVAVAFWGRVLSNLRTRRSRRKLSSDQIDRRERLEAAVRGAIAEQWHKREGTIRGTIATRRRREAEWMLALLDPHVASGSTSGGGARL